MLRPIFLTFPFLMLAPVISVLGQTSNLCKLNVFDAPERTAAHLSACSQIPQPEYPPVSGNHYGIWAALKEYSQPVPAGFWLHNLEHGAIVLLYRCPEGCADELQQLRALVKTLPSESATCAPTDRRAILAPDTLLRSRFAVLAWGHSLSSDCLDSAAFRQFISQYFRHAPEDICGSGADLSSEGWCDVAGIRSRSFARKGVQKHATKAAGTIKPRRFPDGRLLSKSFRE